MSLDVCLHRDEMEFLIAADWCDEHGYAEAAACLRQNARVELYDSNITHNLTRMAEAAGIYQACWRPEEIGVTKAKQLVPLLEEGLRKLKEDPERYQQFNASNGWGLYEHFVPWVEAYLAACREHPEADVSVSR